VATGTGLLIYYIFKLMQLM